MYRKQGGCFGLRASQQLASGSTPSACMRAEIASPIIAMALSNGVHKTAVVIYAAADHRAIFGLPLPLRHLVRRNRRIRDYGDAQFRLKFRL